MTKELGKAVLFILPTINLSSGNPVVFEEFVEGEGDLDPYHRAVRMRDSVGDDFGPEAIITIGLNERARALMQGTRMKAMGFDINEDGTWTNG